MASIYQLMTQAYPTRQQIAARSLGVRSPKVVSPQLNVKQFFERNVRSVPEYMNEWVLGANTAGVAGLRGLGALGDGAAYPIVADIGFVERWSNEDFTGQSTSWLSAIRQKGIVYTPPDPGLFNAASIGHQKMQADAAVSRQSAFRLDTLRHELQVKAQEVDGYTNQHNLGERALNVEVARVAAMNRIVELMREFASYQSVKFGTGTSTGSRTGGGSYVQVNTVNNPRAKLSATTREIIREDLARKAAWQDAAISKDPWASGTDAQAFEGGTGLPLGKIALGGAVLVGAYLLWKHFK